MILEPNDQNPVAPAYAAHIFDATTQNFEQDVMMASMERPIIVDFWAPWCGPCKQLMPILEKVITAYDGQVRLAKINIDDHQELAAAMRVQSVPSVFAFFQGQPIDAFQGVLPESQIKAFIDKALQIAINAQPDAIDIPSSLKAAADALAEKDAAQAHSIYSLVLQQEPVNAQAYAGLIRAFILAEQTEQAKGLIDNVPEEIADKDIFKQAVTAFKLTLHSTDADLGALQKAIEDNPKDMNARYDLADALFSSRQSEASIEHLLYIIEHDKEWNDGLAKARLLEYFEALGPADPLSIKGRRKLSSFIFS